MKILTFIHSFELGGVEKIALRLAASWKRMGFAAPVFVGRDDGAMKPSLVEGLDISYPKAGPVNPVSFETLWMIWTLPRFILNQRPDVLFCSGNRYTVVAVILKLILRQNCPPVVTKISNDLYRRDIPVWWRWSYYLWLRFQGRFFDRVIGMAEPMRAEIRDQMRIPDHKIAIIPDPALGRISFSRRCKERHTGRRYIAVGRLVAQKNYTLLVSAFAQMAGVDDHLTILGEGPERAQLERLIEKLSLQDQVSLAGYCDDVRVQLENSDIFVLSSDFEGVPAALLEAMAVGLNIVTTNCSVSMNWMLDNGKLGQVVPTGNLNALADAMDAASELVPNSDQTHQRIAAFTLECASSSYVQLMENTVRIKSAEATHTGLRA